MSVSPRALGVTALDDLRQLVVSAANRHAVGGLAVGVVRGADLIFSECLGVADPTGQPVEIDTVFQIASVSKTMTAIGLMQLHERGRFELDDPIDDYLKSFRLRAGGSDWPAVTFRHLLTHTGGLGELPRAGDLLRPRVSGLVPKGRRLPLLNELYRGEVVTEIPAGTKWAYANHGFAILGQLVEDVSGQSLPEYMIDHVFEPLGMLHTDYLASQRVTDRMASGYQLRFGRMRKVRELSISLLGAGAVRSSLRDLTSYAVALLNGGANDSGSVVSPDSLEEMLRPHYRPDERLPAMGLAFFLDQIEGHRIAGHDGNNPGFNSSLVFAPDDGLAVTVLTNTGSPLGAHLLSAAILRSLLEVPDPVARLPRPDVVHHPHLWGDLCGVYRPAKGFLTNLRSWGLLGGEAEVAVRKKRLVLRALSPIKALRRGLCLYPVASDDPLAFEVVLEGLVVPIVFGRDESGRVVNLSAGGPAFVTLQKRPPMTSYRRGLRTSAILAGVGGLKLRRRRMARRMR
jgi:CubicO group peptidase (beta-lactamase class C family)